MQFSKPWMSDIDIPKGAHWPKTLSEELAKSQAGILCVTHENKEKPWLLFEAGSLARNFSDQSRVCVLLFDLEPKDLPGPLSLYQAAMAEKEDMWKMLLSLNRVAGDHRLDEDRLRRSFERCWPDLDTRLNPLKQRVDANANTAKVGTYYHSPFFPVRGLHHISLPVKNLETSMGFYYGTLHLRQADDPEINHPERARPDFGFPGAWFEFPDGQQLHLIEYKEKTDAPVTFRDNEDVNFKDVHFAVRVRDYDAMYEILSKDKRVRKIYPGPRQFQCYILDPDYHIIEVTGFDGPGPKRS
jgi:catechol 2,3-dioxygenase-like lactoylglutathione lyase family enzyme